MGRTPTVRDSTGNILLANGTDYPLTENGLLVLLLHNHGGVNRWVEIARSRLAVEDLADTGKGIPYPISKFIAGALSTGVQKVQVWCPHEIVVKNAHGRVGTAPSGGACIVDILDDGNSIFNNQAEMVNIADGTTSDTSATKNHTFAQGSIITLEVEAANGAADLTVTFDAYVDPKMPPV